MSPKQTRENKKGFTLIELIITISILAILIAIVVVALNPAEQAARARDSKRVADLDAVKTAIILYMAQATGTVNLSGDTTVNDRCFAGGGTDSFFTNTLGTTTAPGGFTWVTSTGQSIATATPVSAAVVWMPALLGATPGGAPLSNLPLDPTNRTGSDTTLYYAYACDFNDKTFELTARLESTYYKTDLDLDGTDGGNSSSTYEVGTKLSVLPNGF